MQTRSQRYATRVWDSLAHTQDSAGFEKAKYGSMSHKLPILIRTCGLTQALAFAATRKNKSQSEYFLDDLASAVGLNSRHELLEHSRTDILSDYMILTQHTLDALLWFKRFAQSELGILGTEDDEDDVAVPAGGATP